MMAKGKSRGKGRTTRDTLVEESDTNSDEPGDMGFQAVSVPSREKRAQAALVKLTAEELREMLTMMGHKG